MYLTADQLREKYMRFFEQRGHVRVPHAPLVPENDPSVLFTSAGMHPLVPFLLGEPHPAGKRLVDVQPCLRTDDITEVGDASHLTFFEMLGNWSLGDYFKKESLAWSLEFLTQDLGLEKEKISVTCFAGDADAPRDNEAADVWRSLGIPAERIYFLPKKDNWWGPAGASGPCGPDSEIFYDTGQPPCGPNCQPGDNCGKYLEIWNNVFMQYNKTPEGKYELLKQKNVDTGMGVERTVMVLQGREDVFETEMFSHTMDQIAHLSGKRYRDPAATRAFRVIADHLRASTFLLANQVVPGNVEQGYILRRLIRRAVRHGRTLGIGGHFTAQIAERIIADYAPVYPELEANGPFIIDGLTQEEEKFARTLDRGLREFEKLVEKLAARAVTHISAGQAFNLYETFGFPLEITTELAQERGLTVDEAGFEERFKAHQALSRKGAEQKFAGGLADRSEETTRLHTATHLLQQALRDVLGTGVHQMGSNITPERLRFDFSYPQKVTDEQLRQVEEIVNHQIQRQHPVTMEMMPLQKALDQGALAFFGEKYGDTVKVYTIGDFSKEVCGGPHVSNTSALGKFKITKEEAVSQGVRRVRAILTKE